MSCPKRRKPKRQRRRVLFADGTPITEATVHDALVDLRDKGIAVQDDQDRWSLSESAKGARARERALEDATADTLRGIMADWREAREDARDSDPLVPILAMRPDRPPEESPDETDAKVAVWDAMRPLSAAARERVLARLIKEAEGKRNDVRAEIAKLEAQLA